MQKHVKLHHGKASLLPLHSSHATLQQKITTFLGIARSFQKEDFIFTNSQIYNFMYVRIKTEQVVDGDQCSIRQ
jgi:hypothetical protein